MRRACCCGALRSVLCLRRPFRRHGGLPRRLGTGARTALGATEACLVGAARALGRIWGPRRLASSARRHPVTASGSTLRLMERTPGTLYRESWGRVVNIVSSLDDDALAQTVAATPKWSARDVLGHLAGA